jgi:hypothetical protein
MHEYHALVSVTAVDVEQADAFFERIERDARAYGGKLVVIPSASAMEDPRMAAASYEPHPRLERLNIDGHEGGGATDGVGWPD